MYRFYRAMYGLVGFSRSQTNGFLIFLPLLLLIVFSAPIYRSWRMDQPADHVADIRKVDSLLRVLNERPQETNEKVASIQFSDFNPNLNSADELIRSGLPDKIAMRMIRYREKGGKFNVKSDLLKLYGMDSGLYHLIRPHILLPEARQKEKSRTVSRAAATRPSLISRREKKDLNKADTAVLKRIFGIGEKLSVRILKYREALGGFVSMEQLREIYKLDTLIIRSLQNEFFIASDFAPVQLRLNAAGRQDLAVHPYLSSRAADAIVAYRFQHGDFVNIEDLRKIPAIDSATLRKVLPYLKL